MGKRKGMSKIALSNNPTCRRQNCLPRVVVIEILTNIVIKRNCNIVVGLGNTLQGTFIFTIKDTEHFFSLHVLLKKIITRYQINPFLLPLA